MSILRLETIAQAGKGASVARIELEIVAKDLFCFGGLVRGEQETAKRRTDGRVSRRRLAIMKRVLGGDGAVQ